MISNMKKNTAGIGMSRENHLKQTGHSKEIHTDGQQTQEKMFYITDY